MFFTNPTLNFGSIYREPEPLASPSGAIDIWSSSHDEARKNSQLLSSEQNLHDVYSKHNTLVKELTGADLINPAVKWSPSDARDDERKRYYADWKKYQEDGGSLWQADVPMFSQSSYIQRWREQDYRRKLEELAAKHPEHREKLLPQRSFLEESYSVRHDAERKVSETWDKSNKGLLDWGAWVSGQLTAGVTDPINIITGPLGFGGVGTGVKGLAMGMLKNGGFNAAIEVAQQPFIQHDRNMAGQSSGLVEGATNVAGAFALGAGLDLGIRGTARALRHTFGYEPVVRDGIVIGYRKAANAAPTPEAAAPASTIPPELEARAKAGDKAAMAEVVALIEREPGYLSAKTIDAAEAGDAKAIRAVAETTGMADHPAMRHTLDAMDANEATFSKPLVKDMPLQDHQAAVVQSMRHIAEPELEPPPAIRVGDSLSSLKELEGQILDLQYEVRRLEAAAAETPDAALPDMRMKLVEAETAHDTMRRSIYADDVIAGVDGGKYRPEMAELVADHVADHAIQGKALADLAARNPESAIEARNIIAELLASPDYKPQPIDMDAPPAGLKTRALDDPYGPDAVKQVQALEAAMAEELGRKTAPPPTPEEVAVKVKEIIDHGAKVKAAIEEVTGIIPDGVEVRVFSSIADLPDGLAARVEMANATAVDAAVRQYLDAKSTAGKADARRFLDAAKSQRAIEGIAQDNTIWIAAYAMNPKGRVAHEVVHALRTAGQISPDEIRLLAAHARDTEAFGGKREALYRQELEGRGLAQEQVAALLDEEAAAHAIEAAARKGEPAPAPIKSITDRIAEFFERIRNALRRQGFMTAEEMQALAGKPVNDVVSSFLSGEMAKRHGVKAWMRDEDITAFAMRDEASPFDPAEADSPNLMFAFAGMSENEIAARLRTVIPANDQKTTPRPPSAVSPFLDQFTRATDGASATATSLYEAYHVWAEQVGAEPIALPAFKSLLGQAGIMRQRIAGRDRYVGIEIVPEGERPVASHAMTPADANVTEIAAEVAKGKSFWQSIKDLIGRLTGKEKTPEIEQRIEHAFALEQKAIELSRADNQNAPLNDNKPSNVTYMFAFAGERAKTADLEALTKAKEMDAAGKPRVDIWTATGWFRGVDGNWRFEIDDSQAQAAFGNTRMRDLLDGSKAKDRLRDLLTDSEAMAAYPQTEQVVSVFNRSLVGQGALQAGYMSAFGSTRNNLMKSVAHEFQHLIQVIEGFAPGGSDSRGFLRYLRMAGEAEARVVERRLRMTPEDRRARPPWKDYDIPEWAQIVSAPSSDNWAGIKFDPAGGKKGASEPLFAFVDQNTGREMRRDLDTLGYYSGLIEAAKGLKQAKGTPEQMLAMLQKSGAKAGEIEATGLGKFLEGRPSVTRDEIVQHLEGNRIGLNEVQYGRSADPEVEIKTTELDAPSGKRGYRSDTGNDFDVDQTGFTLLPLSEKVKVAVKEQGQPLFAFSSEPEMRAAMQRVAEVGVELPGGVKVRGIPLFAIRAYHGSPHDFDRFSMEKIGTGEGAQAFGHGLYFAENDGVAKSYRDALSGPRTTEPRIDGRPVNQADPHELAAQAVWEARGSREDALRRAMSVQSKLKRPNAEVDALVATLRSGDPLPVASSGRLYEVRINADHEHFLDWDKPLSEQSEKVRAAIDKALSLRPADARPLTDTAHVSSLLSALEDGHMSRGLAEDALRDYGVAGIRYLDQGSRASGEGTHNYVVFDDKLIEIVAKDGKPVTAPVGGNEPNFAFRDDANADLSPERIAGLIEPYVTAYPALAQIARDSAEALRDGIDATDFAPILARITSDAPALAEARTALAAVAGPQMAQDIEIAVLRALVTGESPLDGVDLTGIARQMLAQFAPPERPASEPMFALRDADGLAKLDATSRAQQLRDDLEAIEKQFAAARGDDRAKLQAKRAALLNAQAQERLLDDTGLYKDMFGRGDRARALMATIEAHGELEKVPFADLVSMKKDIEAHMLSMIEAPLWAWRKGAVLGDLRRKLNSAVRANIENVYREIHGISTDDAAAKEFAKALSHAFEYGRQRFNAGGGDIGKLDLDGGYFPQFHDADALVKYGRDKWVDYLMQDGVLDRKKIIDYTTGLPIKDADLRAMLKDIWLAITTDGASRLEVGDVAAGRGAFYKRHMEHRVLHFTPEGGLRYNRDFGGGDLYAAAIGHLNMMARDIALIERFGPNPDVTMKRVQASIIKEAKMQGPARSMFDDFKARVDQLRQEYAALPSEVDEITSKMGEVHAEIDRLRADAGNSKRARQRIEGKVEGLRKQLGPLHDRLDKAMQFDRVTPAQQVLIDKITAAGEEMLYAGQWMVTSRNQVQRANRLMARADEMMSAYNGTTNTPISSTFAGLMVGARNFISSASLVYAPFSAVTDQATQMAARQFIGMPATRQLNAFVKGFTQGDRRVALEAGLGLDQVAAAFAQQARFVGAFNARSISGYIVDRTHAYSGLSPMTQASKVAFGIDFLRWMGQLKDVAWKDLPDEVLRMFERHGFTKEDFRDLSAAKVNKHGLLSRDMVADAAGDEVAERYMRMLFRERGQAVIEGTLQGRTAFISDTRPGTVTGELLRSASMLKSFPTSYMMLILRRAYNETMAGRYQSAMAYGAAIFIVGTMLGALAKQLKNVGQGRDPEDMTKAKFWAESFMQSGGAGIFGDFIGSSVNRMGSGLAGTVMGPVADRGGTLLDLTFGNVAQYAKDEKTNAGREFTKVIRQNSPGMFAPWYIRLAYERLLLDELQKKIDPEYYKSFDSRVRAQKKRAGNDFYFPPGGALRAPNFGAAVGRQ